MRLCVFGIEDLDALESAVLSSFGMVPSSPSSQLDFALHGLPLKEEDCFLQPCCCCSLWQLRIPYS